MPSEIEEIKVKIKIKKVVILKIEIKMVIKLIMEIYKEYKRTRINAFNIHDLI